jgi:hypothetical protein
VANPGSVRLLKNGAADMFGGNLQVCEAAILVRAAIIVHKNSSPTVESLGIPSVILIPEAVGLLQPAIGQRLDIGRDLSGSD